MYVRDEKCPICNSKMSTKDYYGAGAIEEYYKECSNSCYYEEYIYGNYTYVIFEDVIEFAYHEAANKKLEKIKHLIKYWKQDDRYLLKILEGCEK